MNPVMLQAKFAMPIKIPEYFGANSITLAEGPAEFILASVVAMVTITIAEVTVDT